MSRKQSPYNLHDPACELLHERTFILDYDFAKKILTEGFCV